MENPSDLNGDSENVKLDDLVGNLTRITKEFQIPAELLE
jgi:D-tyrosyl-tRNA(Tyr) deacylase